MKNDIFKNLDNLVDAPCGACGSFERSCLFENHDRLHGFPGIFKINCCSRCSLVYISPRPKDISKYYVEEYEPYNLNLKDFYQTLDSKLMSSYYGDKRGFFQWIKSKFYKLFYNPIPLEYRGKKILDIGCGSSIFLYNLKRFGKFDVYGVEMSDYAAQQARMKLGLTNVLTGTLENNTFLDNFFNVITLNHVIEHVPNPKETLSEIKRILKPNSLLIITTPNTDSLLFKIFKKFWFALETPRHLNLFSERTLLEIINSVGNLKIEKVNYNISNFVFAKSLIYFFDIKNDFLAGLLMKIKILFSPLFYLMPKKKRDFITVYIKKQK